MLGELKKQFSLTRAALSTRGEQKQIPVSLTQTLARAGVFRTAPLFLVDVGASGGIDAHWLNFEPSLHAVGFDPAMHEVDRLNTINRNANVSYVSAFVGSKKAEQLFPRELAADRIKCRWTSAYARFSYIRAREKSGFKPLHERGVVRITDTFVELDEYFERQTNEVNFIKVDTDGHDYEVLMGAERLLESPSLLGLLVESQFNGAAHLHSNILSNIDRLLRDKGFNMFDIRMVRYSRRHLPMPFAAQNLGRTVSGQAVWGDVLFCRDLGAEQYEKTWGMEISERDILKLACIFELHNLRDCAAELLLKYRGRLQGLIDVDKCLDVLTPLIDGKPISFKDYNTLFDENIGAFYPT